MPTKKSTKRVSKTIEPLGDKVLLSPIESESVTVAGIILPESVDTDKGMKEAKVVAVGPGRYVDGGEYIPVEVKKGDVVFYQWGDEIKVDGKEYILVSENNIVAVVK